jgi:hypothetical protein
MGIIKEYSIQIIFDIIKNYTYQGKLHKIWVTLKGEYTQKVCEKEKQPLVYSFEEKERRRHMYVY